MGNPEFNNSKPDLSEHVNHLREVFEGNYQFRGRPNEQAKFVEGLVEFAKVVALTSDSAEITVQVGADGITQIRVGAIPTPAPPTT